VIHCFLVTCLITAYVTHLHGATGQCSLPLELNYVQHSLTRRNIERDAERDGNNHDSHCCRYDGTDDNDVSMIFAGLETALLHGMQSEPGLDGYAAAYQLSMVSCPGRIRTLVLTPRNWEST
jgi:hypothetical protein